MTTIIVKQDSLGDTDITFDDLKMKLDECKLRNDKDPEIRFTELEVLNFKVKGIDKKFKVHRRQ